MLKTWSVSFSNWLNSMYFVHKTFSRKWERERKYIKRHFVCFKTKINFFFYASNLRIKKNNLKITNLMSPCKYLINFNSFNLWNFLFLETLHFKPEFEKILNVEYRNEKE